MGASSIHLAKTRDCRCLGITLVRCSEDGQALSARWHRVSGRVDFRCADAEQVDLPQNSCDVVWSVECTEHLFDKPRFFERAAAWLKLRGTMAIALGVQTASDGRPASQAQIAIVPPGFSQAAARRRIAVCRTSARLHSTLSFHNHHITRVLWKIDLLSISTTKVNSSRNAMPSRGERCPSSLQRTNGDAQAATISRFSQVNG